MNSFGIYFAAKRKGMNMTQADIAKIIHVDRSTVAKWECGDSSPNIAKLQKLAAALGCTIDELVNGKEGEPCKIC